LQTNDSVSFSVQVGAPTISLDFPVGVYLGSGDVEFSYTPTDIDLQMCELFGDFNDTFSLNQTDSSPTSGSVNQFNLTLEDGSYLWNIRCNDTIGNSAFNGNKTFYVDTTNPEIVLTEPNGTKSSSPISAIFNITDNLNIDYCWYNVTNVNGEALISNREISNCSVNTSLSFTLGDDESNANFNLYANDSAGNSDSATIVFSFGVNLGIQKCTCWTTKY